MKVTIHIEDKEDGTVGVKLDFEPALRDGDPETSASYLAGVILQVIGKEMRSGEEA